MTDTDVYAATRLPQIKSVKDMLTDLLGRDVDVLAIDHWTPEPNEVGVIAEFVDDQQQVRAVAILDLALSVFAGAAIGMLPPGGAQDMVGDHELTPLVQENLFEVLNIASALFNTPGNAHVKIGALLGPEMVVPAQIAPLIPRVTGRLDLAVDIHGYGNGRLGLILA